MAWKTASHFSIVIKSNWNAVDETRFFISSCVKEAQKILSVGVEYSIHNT